jgi:DNA-binding NarL/FixJ family response regulator
MTDLAGAIEALDPAHHAHVAALLVDIVAARELLAKLTPREADVLDCMTRGMPNKEIARTLGISPRTVEIHRVRAARTLGVRRSAEVIRIAVLGGRIAPPFDGTASENHRRAG